MTTALQAFPVGTQVRLHPDYLKALGAEDGHGVGVVTGPVPNTPDWQAHQPGADRMVMVKWPERPINGQVIEVPALMDNLVRVSL